MNKNISIVTGTLNRLSMLPDLIENTVDGDNRLELILVDGGSTDGTIEYLKDLNHPHIKLIEVGGRSSYPHFMNLGIEHSSYDFICQWNDDVLLVNEWDEVFKSMDDSDFYIFNWKYGSKNDIKNNKWLNGFTYTDGWCLLDNTHINGEIVMNYGIYNKKIFKSIGMYNDSYRYYYADGDMSYRANKFGYKHKSLKEIKVCSLITPKNAIRESKDSKIYTENRKMYDNSILPKNLKYLK